MLSEWDSRWTDVSFKRLEDGRMWFCGTAYFKKLDELEIPNQSMLKFAWKNQGGGKADLTLNLKKSERPKPKADAAKLTPEEHEKKIKDGSQDMELKLRLDPDNLKSASLVVDGAKTEIKRSGYSSSSGITTFTFGSKTAFPEKGSIVVEIHDKLQTFDVPFKIENLSLLGMPMK